MFIKIFEQTLICLIVGFQAFFNQKLIVIARNNTVKTFKTLQNNHILRKWFFNIRVISGLTRDLSMNYHSNL